MATEKIDSGVSSWEVQPIELDSVDAREIDARTFQREYVNQCRPLLIRGATSHWPAAERWHRADYLQKALNGNSLEFFRQTRPEMRWRRTLWPERFEPVFAAEASETADFSDLANLAAQNEVVFAYALELSRESSLAPLVDDIGNFPFLPDPGPTHYYKPKRAFVHGLSYTDWHYHPDDETLMCQFGRSKLVHMLPPSQQNWDVFYEVAEQVDIVGTARPDRFPRLKTLHPFVAQVHHGDAIYIPPNWWHAVDCAEAGRDCGVTVAYCWGSPLHIRSDPRFPFHRFYMRHGRLKNRLKVIAASVIWAGLSVTGGALRTIPGSIAPLR